MTKRIALYLRVSTVEQDTTNQRLALERWAAAHGHVIAGIYEDAGISGAKGRDQRPQFDAMLKAATRREFDVVAAWAVDRLGRSLQHLIETLNELRAVGVGLFLHQQGFDTATPAGRMMFQMLGVIAEFERAMVVERVHAGLTRARTQGTRSGKPIGRAPTPLLVRNAAREALLSGQSVRQVCRATGVSVGVIGKLRSDMVRAGEIHCAVDQARTAALPIPVSQVIDQLN